MNTQTQAQTRMQRQLEDDPALASKTQCYRCAQLIGDAEYRVTYEGSVRHVDCDAAERARDTAKRAEWDAMLERVSTREEQRQFATAAIHAVIGKLSIKDLGEAIALGERNMDALTPEAQPYLRNILASLRLRRDRLIADAHVAAFAKDRRHEN